jgi:hypothetical protein
VVQAATPSTSESATILTFPILGQRDSKSYRAGSTLMDALDTIADSNNRVPVKDLACAATVYTMIERGRDGGNPAATVDDFYPDPRQSGGSTMGASPPTYVGKLQAFDLDAVVSSLHARHPVVLVGKGGKLKSHYVLVVGMQTDEGITRLRCNDPWNGVQLLFETTKGSSSSDHFSEMIFDKVRYAGATPLGEPSASDPRLATTRSTTSPSPEMAIETADGSRFVGQLSRARLVVATKYGSQEIDAADLVEWVDGKVKLSDGTTLVGRLTSDPVKLLTARGEMTLPVADIKQITSKAKASASPSGSPTPAAADTPTEAMAEEILRGQIAAQSQGAIDLSSFQKTNGQQREMFGVKLYSMEFSAETIFQSDAKWLYDDPVMGLHAFRTTKAPPPNANKQFNWGDFMEASQNPGETVRRGEHRIIQGTIDFERKEKGWQGRVGRFTSKASPKGSASPATQSVAAGDRTAPNFEEELRSRLGKPASQPSVADKNFTDQASGVAIRFPARLQRVESKAPIIADFKAADAPAGTQETSSIFVSCAKGPLFGRVTLDELYRNTVTNARKIYPACNPSQPIRTTLAGSEAYAFTYDLTERGQHFRKVITLGFAKGKVIGVILTAPAETLDEWLEDYKRVCQSFELR